MSGPIRRPVIAGSWYPGKPETLKKDIAAYLNNVRIPEIPVKPVAVVSPHAGYMYSGPVAAYAYKAVQGRDYATVVVVSPSHRAYFPHVAVWPKGCYETPLGIIEVDEELCAGLMDGSAVVDDPGPHGSEHALEIQLPFLQHVLGTFRLCPLIMGTQDLAQCRVLAEALGRCVRDPDNTLVVASSDLSHFHSSKSAEDMDKRVASRIVAFDAKGLSDALEKSTSEACGGGPIITAMLYGSLLGRTTAKVLRYAHSGHITGDNSSVVGYLSAVIY